MELKLDIDNIAQRKRAVWFLLSLQKPYEIRISSGGKGVHIIHDCSGCPRERDCYQNCWIYQWDDKRRLALNLSRNKIGIPHNYLWDSKGGKKAGKWNLIETAQDVDRFLRQITGFY